MSYDLARRYVTILASVSATVPVLVSLGFGRYAVEGATLARCVYWCEREAECRALLGGC